MQSHASPYIIYVFKAEKLGRCVSVICCSENTISIFYRVWGPSTNCFKYFKISKVKNML